MGDYFYGWYFRCQEEQCVAVIPAVHFSGKKHSCSIQVITQKESFCKEFPISQFRINQKKGIMHIGENVFSKKGIYLKFETALADGTQNIVEGTLHFGKFTKPKYDIMGPFSFLSGMQCRHAVYSERHRVKGELNINRRKICFQNGMGYMEGDSGTSFPERYFWTQHFVKDGSIMLAIASIPLGRIHFTGTIGFWRKGNKEHRFATYLGAKVKKMNDKEVMISQGRYQLWIRFAGNEGRELKAPVDGKMIRKIKENVAGEVEYILMRGKRVIFYERTERAATEYYDGGF